ncbi:MAG TPA: TraB/GumN family protein [Methylophilaceae bacterium]|nr:TraB/GumN family protein [Methylophilaceae bacterium]
MSRCILKPLLGAMLIGLLASVPFSHAEDIGLLWKAESPAGKTSYLFGTMHSDDTRINDFSAALLKAIADSEIFMVEVLPAGDHSVYFMPEGKLSSLLSEQEHEQVMQLADFHVMDRAAVNRMKPWLLAVMFDQPRPASIFSQDIMLRGIAQNHAKPLLALEENDRHFLALDSLSMEEQLTMLRTVLKRSQEDKERDFESLLSAYLSGNLAQIAGVDEEMTGGLLPADIWQKIRVKLLDERNMEMADRIIQQAGTSTVFVAVGASHLAGSGGLLQRLRSAGFRLSPVK